MENARTGLKVLLVACLLFNGLTVILECYGWG